MRILVLSPRLTESRRAAFRALTQGLGERRLPGPGEPAPEVSASAMPSSSTVRSPRIRSRSSAAMRAAVERGAALVAIGGAPVERDGFWADLLGVDRRAGAAGRRVLRAGHRRALPHLRRVSRASSRWSTGSCPLIPLGGRQGHRRRERRAPRPRRGRGDASRAPAGWSRAVSATPTPRSARPSSPSFSARALRPDLHCCGRNIGVGIVGYGPLGGHGLPPRPRRDAGPRGWSWSRSSTRTSSAARPRRPTSRACGRTRR